MNVATDKFYLVESNKTDYAISSSIQVKQSPVNRKHAIHVHVLALLRPPREYLITSDWKGPHSVWTPEHLWDFADIVTKITGVGIYWGEKWISVRLHAHTHTKEKHELKQEGPKQITGSVAH